MTLDHSAKLDPTSNLCPAPTSDRGDLWTGDPWTQLVQLATQLQVQTVARWHRKPVEIDSSVDDFLSIHAADAIAVSVAPGAVVSRHVAALANDRVWWSTVCQQHSFNFQLWHEEDLARSPVASDGEIAQVKRAIDRFNQSRNDWIEKVDDLLSQQIEALQITVRPNAGMNTETPGSALDRLSIMALRIYHLDEQMVRLDVDADHRQKVRRKLEVCQQQHVDLAHSLGQLLSNIFSGSVRHRTYRQCKMYNDPTLNPQVYGQKRAA